jgi:integrase
MRFWGENRDFTTLTLIPVRTSGLGYPAAVYESQMGGTTQSSTTPEGNPLEIPIQKRLNGLESGAYRQNTESVLQEFGQWLVTERDSRSIATVDEQDCCAYAQYLRDERDLSGQSVNTYFSYVRAFLGWAVRDGWIDRNPAETETATEPLPSDVEKPDRQFWSSRDRAAICAFVDRRVDATLDGETGLSRNRAFRDRAIVKLLALSGVRGAEVFRDPRDERRSGITWSDVDFEASSIEVLGKSREYERAQLPTEARVTLERYQRVGEPPTEDSPVFPTDHAPSNYRAVRDQLADRGHTNNEIEALLEENPIDELLHEYEIILPAISTAGARNLMQRLCEEAELDIDGEYLKPHGGRRGLGHELYSKGHSEVAQSALRHRSIETTHAAYSDIKASETAERVDEALNE